MWNRVDKTFWPLFNTLEYRVTVTTSDGLSARDRAFQSKDLFFGLLFLGCANGLIWRALEAVRQHDWTDAILNTFNVSAIVWLSCLFGLILLFSARPKRSEINKRDWAIGSAALALIAIPVGACSWAAVTLACVYLLLERPDDDTRRGATILLAVTAPMLWTRLIYRFFAPPVLAFDARLVSSILGTTRHGNVVGFADHSGNLIVEIPCSSLANVSLALLCWVAVSQFVRHQPRRTDVLWCAAACLSVVVVNVIRMAAMGINVSLYEAIHGGVGSAVTNLLVTALIVVFTGLGVRGELSRMV
jgi:hypothetical protein